MRPSRSHSCSSRTVRARTSPKCTDGRFRRSPRRCRTRHRSRRTRHGTGQPTHRRRAHLRTGACYPTSGTRRCSSARARTHHVCTDDARRRGRPGPGVRARGAEGVGSSRDHLRGGVLRVRVRDGGHDRSVDRRDRDVHPHRHEEHAADVGGEHLGAGHEVERCRGGEARRWSYRRCRPRRTPRPRSASSAPRSTTRCARR